MKTSIRHPRRLLSHLFLFTLLLGACHGLRAQSASYFLDDPADVLTGSTENAAYKSKKAVEVLSFAFSGGRSFLDTGSGVPLLELNPVEFVIQNDPLALKKCSCSSAVATRSAREVFPIELPTNIFILPPLSE